MRTRLRMLARRTSAWAALTLASLFLMVGGCSEEKRAGTSFESSAPNERNFTQSPAAALIESIQDEAAPPGSLAPRSQAPADSKAAAPPAKSATAGRKIIYNTSVELVTEDLNQLEARLLRIIEVQGAYVADSDRTGATGATRHGNWKIRIPVDRYEAFVRGVLGLGELVSNKSRSEDVSAEYYDLDARQTAKKVEEARLLKHLADSTGRLEEILAVERELSRVRSEIEQMQGRLAVLSNLTALATVTVTASEIKDYVPPQAPTLGQRVARTFAGSLDSLRSVSETTLLVVVALIPWLPILIPAVFLLLVFVRRANAYMARTITVAPPARAG